MGQIFKRLYFFLKFIGIDPLIFYKNVRALPIYIKEYRELKAQRGSDKTFDFGKLFPFLRDRSTAAGVMFGQYFTQDLFVAQKIFRDNPRRHVDIGSRIDGFVAHVAVFREIEIFDIREQSHSVENIVFRKADLTNLPDGFTNYSDSISALHSIEHFGLGRYGDPIKYNGYLDALENVYQILKPGGKFYFSVPIGKQRIEFNAHRIFSVSYLLSLFQGKYRVDSFSFMDDDDKFFKEVQLSDSVIENTSDFKFGLGIFELTKL